MSGSKPVQLCKDLSSKGWELDVETLWEIMEPAADLPVAVYSIAGAFRKGKSFMLTLFLRFLRRARNGEGESWLTNVEEELEAGFEWRSGSDRCTSGIWIWNEPFYIDTPEHGKVALFLMDTQGAFHEKTSVQSFSTIFALSTFVSSLQIFNVKDQIQQDSLQQLELFTEFAKTAKESNPEDHRGQPFQELLFLVRDWPNVDEGYGFENGAKELEKLLEKENDCEDIDSVRKNVKFSFENLRCFLMNEPERKVRRRNAKSPPLKIKDLGEDFLNDVDNLVKGIFSPDKLIIKKVNGKIINGHELRGMSKTYSEIFGKGKMPKLGTIAEANAKAAIEPVLREGQKRYRETMEKAQEHGYVDPKKLQAIHKKKTEEMLIWYDDQRKLGSDGFKKEKKVYLGQQLEKRFEECESRNESAKKSQKVEIGYLKSKIIGTFKANLKTSTEGKYLEEEDLKEVLQKWESEAIESFEKETKQFHPELVKGLRKDFKIEMEAERKYIEERNQEMKDAAFYKCGKKQNDAVEKYKTNIENCIKKTPCQDQRDLEVRHDRYKDEAMKEFEKFKEVPLDYFNEQKKKLEEKIQDLFEKAECQNKDNVERKIDAIVADARADFLKEINAFYDGRGALIFVDAILKPLLDIIEKFACGKETKSSTEFYKEHVSKTKFNEIHEKLLKMKCDAVQDQIQGPQNQAEAMKRIEAALYEIGRKIFFAAACLALLQSTLIAGVTGAGVATGAAIGSFGGPIGTSIGTGIGAIAGFAAGMGAADSLEKLFWRWVERI